MAKSSLIVLQTAALVSLLAASPAFAQFGDVFRDPPPRPPADLRNAPGQPRGGQPDIITRPDLPPAQPLPAPMNLPPASRPGARSIQSAPLAPPPGMTVAPEPPAGEPPQQQAAPGVAPLPGLPPGVRQPRGTPQPANTAPQPGDEVVVEPPGQRIANPHALFSGLDKITGRIIKFDVAINETVQFGALQVTPRACYTRPPTETQNTDGFVEVDEVTLQGETRRIFTGWMFAASPGLHAVEHPIYDVWLADCKGAQPAAVAADVPVDAPKPPAAKPPARAQQTTQQPRRAVPQQQPSFQPPVAQPFQPSASPPPFR